MLAEELIVDNIPPLKLSDTGETAMRWMDDFKVNHLSVVDGAHFLGTISENDVLSMSDLSNAVGDYRELFNPVSVNRSQHIFEVVKVVNEHMLSIIPVLDSKGRYSGSITISQLMTIIADMPMVNDIGGIIVLELNIRDYSFSEISRIIEENNTRLLGSFITSHPESTKMHLTLKVNSQDIGGILASFERHDYTVVFSDGQNDAADDLHERFDSFMNYLNI